MKELSVSQSKIKQWRNCRQAFHYKHVEEIQPKRTRRPFAFGKIVHRMVEAEAQEDDPVAVLEQIDLENLDLFTAEKEMYGEIIADIKIIMADYFQYWRDGLRMLPVEDESGELRYAEHEFAIPLQDMAGKQYRGIVFKGQIDGLGKTPNKLRWLVEHKTFDKLPGDDERWRNVQSVVYVRAVEHLKWLKRPLDGVCWNYIKSKPPTVPQVLKDGSRLSAREIVTLPSVVLAALKVHKLRAEDHQELLRAAEQSRREYFQRIYTPINGTIVSSIWSGFLDTAEEMREYAGKRRDKNIGRHCSWCDYEPLCRAELTGGDVDFAKEHDYTHEDPESYRRTARGKRSDKLKIVAG